MVNGGMSTERETIRHVVQEAARTLLKQMEEHFHKLEAEVSRLHFFIENSSLSTEANQAANVRYKLDATGGSLAEGLGRRG